ncbi:hypothetical protein IQ249_13520 [Lusitaniella coriacea LEGE 07157]|uniref:Uncharacterized protein n=1 Tax=Lusitaniella coriacea LEGE 07157 TaxID=945747 RepID=A0A8J7E020_9CYAN|nr:Asr1405/Asl0597 family protein [Lusitaniella coriacea]MBE9116921.1 hypothetical protein [Lusitaniella coriacea LEGE 07157]
MNSTNPEPETEQVVDIQGIERWSVYRRLQELHIPCHCATHQPLQVTLNNSTAAIQFWSVVQQFKASRGELVEWLNRCWQLQQN